MKKSCLNCIHCINNGQYGFKCARKREYFDYDIIQVIKGLFCGFYEDFNFDRRNKK